MDSVTLTLPLRVGRAKRIRGLNTSTPSCCRRCPAAMCSCLGCERRQNQATVDPARSVVISGALGAFACNIGADLRRARWRGKEEFARHRAALCGGTHPGDDGGSTRGLRLTRAWDLA